MTLPGFTAQFGLNDAEHAYRNGVSAADASRAIVPQSTRTQLCTKACADACSADPDPNNFDSCYESCYDSCVPIFVPPPF